MSKNVMKLTLNNGKVFVWRAKDWLKLREEHRIVGELVGTLAHLPRQEVFLGLPQILMPEEVSLLVEREVASLVQYPALYRPPTNETKQQFKKYLEEIQQEQIEYFLIERKRQISDKIDQIIDGKQRKSLGIKTPKKKKGKDVPLESHDMDDINKEDVLKEELDKVQPIPESHTLVQTFTAHPWLEGEDEEECVWNYPSSSLEKLRYLTYKDMWERAYYITSGAKFGVDFLIYPGDPIKFHACFLVVCMDTSVHLSGTELVTLGRLGTSVRKTVVLSSLSDDEEHVQYQSLTWSGIS